jgi:hypothetical protein
MTTKRIVLLLILLASCRPISPEDRAVERPVIPVESIRLSGSEMTYPAIRFVDREYGVVCYVYRSYISCVPLEGR